MYVAGDTLLPEVSWFEKPCMLDCYCMCWAVQRLAGRAEVCPMPSSDLRSHCSRGHLQIQATVPEPVNRNMYKGVSFCFSIITCTCEYI